MFNVKNEGYPSYSQGVVGLNSVKDNEKGDISSDGELSDKFTEFYSKGIMPETPASEGVPATNQVVVERDNSGGWLYIEENGYLFANLKNGNYTRDQNNEVWNEEDSNPDDGGNPGEGGSIEDLGSLIPDESDSWIINENGELQWVKGTNGNNKHGDLEFTEENTGLKTISEITFTSEGQINDITIENGEFSDNGDGTYTIIFNEPQPTPLDSIVIWFPNEDTKVITGVEVKP